MLSVSLGFDLETVARHAVPLGVYGDGGLETREGVLRDGATSLGS